MVPSSASPSVGNAINRASRISVGVHPLRSAQVLAKTAFGLRMDLGDDGDQVPGLVVEVLARVLDKGKAQRLGSGFEQVAQCVTYGVEAYVVSSTCRISTGLSDRPMTFCATPPTRARPMRLSLRLPMTIRSA